MNTTTTTQAQPTLAVLMMSVLDRLANGESFNAVVEETGITARVAEAIQKQAKPAFYILQEGGSSSEGFYVHGFDTADDAEKHRVSCAKAAYRTTPVVEVSGVVANCDGNFDQALSDVLNSMADLGSVDVPEGDEHVYMSPSGDEFVVTEDGKVDGPAGDFLEKLTTAYGRMTFDEIDPETIAGEIGLELLEA